jgi:hypothetical protein
MLPAEVAKVQELEKLMLQQPQIAVQITHTLHAGLYARTACIPAGVMITGALIKVNTVLIVSGDTTVFIGNRTMRLHGYHVLQASAGRKQAFIAHAELHLTMLFATDAATVEEAEAQFTEEHGRLSTRKADSCQA